MTRNARTASQSAVLALGALVLAGLWLPAGAQIPAVPELAVAPNGAMAEQTIPQWPLVTGEWLEANLRLPGLVILHATRDGSDYDAGHIPGARPVLASGIAWEGETGVGSELRSFPEIREALEDAGVSDWSTVVVYGTDLMQSARLWMTLDVAGAGSGLPLFLDGGLPLWMEEGRPVATEAPLGSRGRLTLRPDSGRVATAEWILARLGHEDLSLLDARPEDQFLGADAGNGSGLNPGHIPNARHLPLERLVESPEQLRFRPREEMAAIFQYAGANPSDQVVTYCGVGMRASVTYMLARMLGYETRIFDGSWRDWGARDYPHIPRTRRAEGS